MAGGFVIGLIVPIRHLCHNHGRPGHIRADARRMGHTVGNPCVDTVPIARHCFPGLVNHKLGTVARHLGVLGDAEHRGLADATVVARIMLHALTGPR